ncbi:hypothetical protein E2C01_071208 [Portunus trituberculatus]|uniref:Uncharacterized protein n=1 Tax=Portunus trituberculatus TaxID=210409 RepID=A0A5B7I469_PORTR|nr:hypothetical protein [Portunus trituberculatus]
MKQQIRLDVGLLTPPKLSDSRANAPTHAQVFDNALYRHPRSGDMARRSSWRVQISQSGSTCKFPRLSGHQGNSRGRWSEQRFLGIKRGVRGGPASFCGFI